MSRILWGQTGQRLYEAGLDRGVLYLPHNDDRGVPWNGLTSIDENDGGASVEPVYFEGVKYHGVQKVGDFGATLSAFMYPEEFDECEGLVSLGNGLFVDNQPPKPFGMSFRTKVGNELEGLGHGYKVHLLYNLTAIPNEVTRQTMSDPLNLTDFSWEISAVPVPITNYRPTAHVILDSRYLPSEILSEIENILYGSEGYFPGDVIYDGGYAGDEDRATIDGGYAGSFNDPLPDNVTIEAGDPRLPSIEELIDIVTLWGPRFIIPDTVTGLADLVASAAGDITQTNVAGVYTGLPDNRLSETEVPGIFELLP